MRSPMPRVITHAVAALLVVGGVLGAGSCASQQSPALAPAGVGADELLVGFAPGTTAAQAEAVYAPLGATKLEVLANIDVHRIRVAPGSIDSVERVLKQSQVVRFVERNRPLRMN
jgi:fervidolysin-like protein